MTWSGPGSPSAPRLAGQQSLAGPRSPASIAVRAHTDTDVDALRRGELSLRRTAAMLPPGLGGPPAQGTGPALSEGGRIELRRDELVAALYALGEALAPMYAGLDSGERAAQAAAVGSPAPDGLETLLRLMSPARKTNPKLEVRRAAGAQGRVGGCVQLALCAQTPAERQQALEQVRSLDGLAGLHEALGGEVTLELHAPGVSKAVPCRYVQRYFADVLAAMGYEPGPVLDARRHRTVIIGDADGTLYDKQETCPDDPLGANLSNSPAREPLLAYLRGGGVLGVCTGNDLERTRLRLLAGIPEHERPTLLRRVFVSGNGGASLATFDAAGRLRDLPGYGFRDPATGRAPGLDNVKQPPSQSLDAVYLGDDHRPSGNDFQGFASLGPARSICVASQSTAEIDPFLRNNHLPGEVRGTAGFLRAVADRMAGQAGLQKPLFSEGAVAEIVSRARSQSVRRRASPAADRPPFRQTMVQAADRREPRTSPAASPLRRRTSAVQSASPCAGRRKGAARSPTRW